MRRQVIGAPMIERKLIRLATMTRRKIKQNDLFAPCDSTVPSAGEGCPAVQPLGRESDDPASPADGPLEKLRGSVFRYDNPTDPVWPIDTESD